MTLYFYRLVLAFPEAFGFLLDYVSVRWHTNMSGCGRM